MRGASLILFLPVFAAHLDAQSVDRGGWSGQQIFQAACASCHGSDGRGQPVAIRGFDIDPPDFTDCSLTTPEANLDWLSVVHQGGPARAFDRIMPAFGDELTEAEIVRVIDHVRTFCVERGWPLGDLNLPRPFVTEKAFPENEGVLTTSIAGRDRSATSSSTNIGSAGVVNTKCSCRSTCRSLHPTRGTWAWAISAPPTNTCCLTACHTDRSCRQEGRSRSPPVARRKDSAKAPPCSRRSAPSASFSRGDGFLHAHAGIEVPADGEKAAKETFWRIAVGKSFMHNRWGRAWSPMLEILGALELEDGHAAEWDALPQLQVSLSTRQHVLVNIGVRTPLSQRSERGSSVLVYLLWDWFDGGFFSGW